MTRTACIRALMILPFVTLPAAAQDAPDRSADEAALTRIKTEVWPGYYRGQDAAGLDSFLDEAFVNIAPDGSVTKRDAEIEWVRANAWAPANFSYAISDFMWIKDDLVIVVGRGSSDRTDETGAPCRHVYASSNLLERAPGAPLGWRALSSHVSGASCDPA